MSMSKLRLHTNKKNRQPLPAQRPQVTQNVKGTVSRKGQTQVSATSQRLFSLHKYARRRVPPRDKSA